MSSKIVKLPSSQQKRKTGTDSGRNFSYKSFTRKIANLKIDPVRRVRNYVDDEETTKSFFKNSFDNWVELNLSGTFTLFVREAGPLCQSLPMIVHNKDRIFEILHAHIDKRDVLALEPLLDLLAQFAHDLGATFEPYLARSVSVLSALVAKHVDVQTIEWTFNCLAYLLKYLSRLLVPDLRPLYEVLAPLLGRENQKSFVVRFAAEALAFLVRKAKGAALLLIVRHCFADLLATAGRKEASMYSYGLMTMFHEACVGVDRTLHSRSTEVFVTMLVVALEQPDADGACLNVVLGVLTGLIHHTTAETFQPITEEITKFIMAELVNGDSADERKTEMAARLLYTCISVRKGGRIRDWSVIGDVALSIATTAHRLPSDAQGSREAMWHTLKAVAVVICTAQVDVVISKCSRIIEMTGEFQNGTLFLPFCEFVAALQQERFATFVQPYLQRFMMSRWTSHERSLCLIIPKLASAGAFRPPKESNNSSELLGPSSPITRAAEQSFTALTNVLSQTLPQWDSIDQLAAQIWRYLDVLPSLLPASDRTPLEAFRKPLVSLLMAISRNTHELRLAPVSGKALALIGQIKASNSNKLSSGVLCTLIVAFEKNPSFLAGAHEYVKRVGASMFDDAERTKLSDSLISTLISSIGDVRRYSLYILDLLSKVKAETPSDIIRAAMMAEEIPLVISNQRNLAMYVRKLGIDYAHHSKDSWEHRIVPYYCFGLMTAKFAPLWEEASKALARVAETNEEVVADLAFKWLAGQGAGDDTAQPSDETQPMTLTAFECSNLKTLERAAEKCVADDFSAKSELEAMFSADSDVSCISVSRARAQALYVLNEVPEIAEKRSRLLVPMFLEWTRMATEEVGVEVDEETPENSSAIKWSHQNQVAMLTVFTKFVNPKVLFQSELVYASLLKLLASGDLNIQSLALKCILSWKTPAIKVYKDQLTNLLDDTRFRDELTHFVQVGEDDSAIQGQHREVLVPVLLRLLYGRCLSRKKAASGRKGMSSNRTAILSALSNFSNEERGQFVDITVGELSDVGFVDKSNPEEFKFNPATIGSVYFSLRKQVGMVKMYEDLLKQLGTTLLPHIEKMLDALVYCLVSATSVADKEVDGDEDPADAKAVKAVRQGGFKVLNAMFHYCPTFNWTPYLKSIFASLVNPRLNQLPTETAQDISSLLKLFSTWASSKHTVLLLSEYNPQVLPKIAQCLGNSAIKDEVVLFIAQLVRKIVQHADNVEELAVASDVKDQLLRPNVDLFLGELGAILRKSLGKDVLEQCIECIAALAPHVQGNTETTQLVDISIFLLDQPTRRVNPKTKSEILKILVNFLPLCIMEKGDELFERTFKSVSSLFGFFRDRPSRKLLANVLQVFAERDEELREVADLSRKLNSFSARRMDEPDFEQRLEAYAIINEERYGHFNAKQWLPLLHNMLFFIRDNEELAIRTNASYALKRFAETCGSKIEQGDDKSFTSTISDVVLPAIRAGAREQSEIIRAEYVAVMAHIVKCCPTLEGAGDMQSLLVGGDEEANFFNNILHIQHHRRGKALRRLAELVKKNNILGSNIAHFLLPLIEHFVFDQAEGEHNLANESVITIGALAQQLEWPQYRAVLKRFMSYIKAKPDLEKIVIRLIGTAINALSAAWELKSTPDAGNTADADGDVNMDAATTTTMEVSKPRCRLLETLPEQNKLANDISNGILPPLSEFLHKKEESTVALRVPVAVSMVKLLKIMPEEMMKAKLPGVLTDVCHILRSRAQDSRDMTRKTLAEIALLLGPEYFSFILKEMRGALLRGYQLHVLSYTMHSILVAVIPTFPSGSLDYCVSSIVAIIMDDIFGVTGNEKDAEGYINKMKEVKSSMSYDSMDVLATITTLPYLGHLVRPIKALLLENLTLKLVKKIDELLRRINIGLMKNEVVKDRNVMVFCYEIVQEVYKEQSTVPTTEVVDEIKKRYIVNLKVPSKNGAKVATSSHISKLIKFALDILRTILGKHQDLMTPENMAGFIPIMGDAILMSQEEVQISSMRLLTAIIRVPLAEIDDGAGIFISKALGFIKSSPSTNSEIAQASLKLISAVLRDRKNVTVGDSTVAYILTKIRSDLEEPDRQGVTFNFLKSVMARKMVIPEVYDIMDQVATIMVTNQTRGVRDLSRSLYFQFLMDYPQGQGRLKKQLAFLVKNLDYAHESGRKSVLDAIYLLVTKIGDNLIQEVVAMFFVPLVMVLVNDESADCREMTGALLKEVFKRADTERQQSFLQLLRTWVDQDEQQLLIRVALQVYGLHLDVAGVQGKKDVQLLTSRLRELLAKATDDDAEIPTEWELIYFGLQLWSRLTQLFPETTMAASSADMWVTIRGCLRFPHAWIRLTSARLLGLLFADYSRSSLSEVPLVNSRGLKLEGPEMNDVAHATSSQLNSPELTDELGLQVVKNLLFLTRCFHANQLPAAKPKRERDDDAATEEESEAKTALSWVIGRISGVIRSERNAKKGIKAKNVGKKYALQYLAAMIQVIPVEDLVPITTSLVIPLYNLVELPDASETKELKSTSQEILSMLQTKIGTTEYAKAYNTVRQRVNERRQERRNKRKVEAITEPEVSAKRKERKHERKKEVRKEKGQAQRDFRHGKEM